MRPNTRIAYNGYSKRMATLNQVDSVAEKFTVLPSVQQALESRQQESSAFLSMINMPGVSEQSGEKIGLGVSGTIASRTNTKTKDRQPQDPSSLQKTSYECKQTNFDTAIGYTKLDAWAKFPDFQTRIRDGILKRQALDRIMIGFNGVEVAAETDRDTNPLLQDVNIGWIQHIKTDAPAQVFSEGVEDSGKITVGKWAGADYQNLDALVFNSVSEFLPEWYQDDPELVVVIGRALLSDKYLPMINNHADTPTESQVLDVLKMQKTIGGLPAVRVPYFPANCIMITRLDNLSIYWQDGGRRRVVIDNPKRDQIENFESSNDAYVVEDYDGVVLIENIALSEAAPAEVEAVDPPVEGGTGDGTGGE